jgi:hypothetical protein
MNGQIEAYINVQELDAILVNTGFLKKTAKISAAEK